EEVLYVNIYSFTIIGKFVKTKKIDTDYIIVPNNTLIRIQEQQKELMEEYNCDFITSEWLEKNEMFDPNNPKEGFNNISKILYIGSPIIEVTDSEAFSDIVDEIRDRLKDFESIRIITSTEEFDRIVTPLYALKRTDSILCVISTIITLSIVSLILYFQIKDRTREIDVFLALGETKNTIALKIISEFVIIGLVALSFSIILCSIIGEYISQYIISKNIIKTTSSELLNMTTRDVIKNFKVFLDVKSVLFISFITIVLIIITSFIGMARIKRISVKSII
ncbi:MAG: FtsX-like permease family protein, partial [Romboutsia sp.]|nr:FtsX-like permease family protein [Romboutsia sp.]